MKRLALLLVLSGCFGNGGGSEVGRCEPGTTPLYAMEASVVDNVAHLVVGHGGGCETHEFAAWWSGVAATSYPPQIPLEIQHYDNGDYCDAFITQSLYIDLSTLPGDSASVMFVQGDGGADQQLGNVNWTRSSSTVVPSDGIALSIDESCGVIGN
jgi:hypothetical protein